MQNNELLEATKALHYQWIMGLPNGSVDITHLAEELDAALGGGLTYWKTNSVSVLGHPEHSAVFLHIRAGELSREQKYASARAIIFHGREFDSPGTLLSITTAHTAYLPTYLPEDDEGESS